ncbi:MAG: hypothetical protein OXB84_02630 [Halobacteriovoraceae bacterium]|nr:hypothetical protein [Halobacteriovoraceae bacterium]
MKILKKDISTINGITLFFILMFSFSTRATTIDESHSLNKADLPYGAITMPDNMLDGNFCVANTLYRPDLISSFFRNAGSQNDLATEDLALLMKSFLLCNPEAEPIMQNPEDDLSGIVDVDDVSLDIKMHQGYEDDFEERTLINQTAILNIFNTPALISIPDMIAEERGEVYRIRKFEVKADGDESDGKNWDYNKAKQQFKAGMLPGAISGCAAGSVIGGLGGVISEQKHDQILVWTGVIVSTWGGVAISLTDIRVYARGMSLTAGVSFAVCGATTYYIVKSVIKSREKANLYIYDH